MFFLKVMEVYNTSTLVYNELLGEIRYLIFCVQKPSNLLDTEE